MKNFLMILIYLSLATGGCKEDDLPTCVGGVLTDRIENCFLILSVLNSPIGEKFSYRTWDGIDTTYYNIVQTSLDINANLGDTIYFEYELVEYGSIAQECPFGPGLGPFITSELTTVDVISYSKEPCNSSIRF